MYFSWIIKNKYYLLRETILDCKDSMACIFKSKCKYENKYKNNKQRIKMELRKSAWPIWFYEYITCNNNKFNFNLPKNLNKF